MNSLALRIYTITVAAVVLVAIMFSINANASARLWQQQAAAQTQLVQQVLARQSPGASSTVRRTTALQTVAPQPVAASVPVTRVS